MNLGYLDDVSLGGPADVVAADVAQIAKVGGDMDLHPNALKCELIAHPNFSTTGGLLQSFIQVDVYDASLLGAPMFHGSELDKSWNGCCDDLAMPGCADLIFKIVFQRPSVSHAALETFDSCETVFSE